ncbi:exported hypothetical protein [Nostocoides australiense Ben110]|uniref:Uncharacterized protein n=1 Tax=Nostocoides australiense Ben110 TaxID=1193182 RepID=W6JYW9_9MICO|nr:exported hypothetical protein [Tetrasphaera australiensis Ben110]
MGRRRRSQTLSACSAPTSSETPASTFMPRTGRTEAQSICRCIPIVSRQGIRGSADGVDLTIKTVRGPGDSHNPSVLNRAASQSLGRSVSAAFGRD